MTNFTAFPIPTQVVDIQEQAKSGAIPRALLTAPHIARGWIDPSALMPFGTILRQDELVAIPQGWREFTAPASGVREIINWTIEALRVGTRVVQDLTFDPSRLFSDVEGTTLIAGPGAEVAAQKDSRGVIVREQPVFAARPKYALEPASGVRNLFIFSEDISNAAWAKILGSVTANADVAGQRVFRLTTDASAGFEYTARAQQTFNLPTGLHTHRIIRGANASNEIVQLVTSAGGAAVGGSTGIRIVVFNTSSGTFTTQTLGTGSSVAATSIGGGLWEITLTFNVTVAGEIFFQTVVDALADPAGGRSVLVGRQQLEAGGSATAYQRVNSQFDVTEAGVRPVHALAYDRVDDWMQLSTAFQPAGNYTLAMGHTHRAGETSWLFGNSSISGMTMVRAGSGALNIRSNNTANQTSFANSTFASATTGRAVAIARVAGTGLADGYMNGFGPLAGTLTGVMTPPNALGINAIGRSVNSFDAPRREYGGVLIDPGNTPVTNEEITLMLQLLAHNEGITL